MKKGKNLKLQFLRRTQKGRGKISLCLFLSALLVFLCACGGTAAPSTAPASPTPAAEPVSAYLVNGEFVLPEVTPAEASEPLQGVGGMDWRDSYSRLLDENLANVVIRDGVSFGNFSGRAYYKFKDGELSEVAIAFYPREDKSDLDMFIELFHHLLETYGVPQAHDPEEHYNQFLADITAIAAGEEGYYSEIFRSNSGMNDTGFSLKYDTAGREAYNAKVILQIQGWPGVGLVTEEQNSPADEKWRFENSTLGDTLDEVLAQEELSQILVEKAGSFAGLDAKAVFAFYPEQGNCLSVGEYRFYRTLPNEEVYRQVKTALVEVYGDARQEIFYDAADAPAETWMDDGSAQAFWSVRGGENAPTPKLDILLESVAGEQVRLQFIAPALP